MSQAAYWALSPLDFLAHAVNDAESDTDGIVARCGHAMPTAAGLDTTPRASLCRACTLTAVPIDLGGWGGPP